METTRPTRTLVLGPAGSGKTTLLRRRFSELVADGVSAARILFLAGSRKAARANEEAVLREAGRALGAAQITTWHAYALGLVGSHYRDLGHAEPPALLTAPEQFALVRQMLGAPEEHARWGDYAHVTALHGFAEELRAFVLRAQDELRSPEEVEAEAIRAGRPELEEAARFMRRYLDQIDAMNLVDHSNALAQAVALLQEHAEIERPLAVLVDDYHDVTLAEETLLAALLEPGAHLVVAADPESHVFGFRGTSLEPLHRFEERFRPASVVELLERKRGTPEPRAWVFDHLAEEADAVSRECRRIRVEEQVAWGDIAVVVRRFGAGSRAIRRAFERDEVPYVVVGEDRPLASEPVLRPMLDLVRAAVRVGDREDLLPGILASPVVGLDSYEVRALRREARVHEATLASLLAAPPADLSPALREPLLRLRALIEDLAGLDAKARPDDVFWWLWERLDYFGALVERAEQPALDAVQAFARQVARFSERRPGQRFSDYLDVLEAAEFGPERWGVPEKRRPDAVRIITAHNAVGFEFEAVIVAGCVEGEFPDLRDTRAMIDIRDLRPPVAAADRATERLEEERRLFGVAASRARRLLLFTAARETSQGRALAPSRLVERLGLRWEPPPAFSAPLTRDEIEAAARRVLADRRAPDHQRLEALDVLAGLPGVDPGAWWYEREWTDPGMPLAAEPLLTSYSRLSAYDNCPLQYLYQRELGLDPDKSHNMTVGSWVHDVIDACAKGAVAAREDALLAALAEKWNPEVFPSVAIEHRFRTDAREMLRRWLATDGKERPLASEVDFTFPLDGATMRGKIDRVVRCGGKSVRLIDYKTSRNARSQEEIDADLQLASYYLALKRDPRLAELGEPIYLQLAFLGAFTKDGGFMRRGIETNKRPNFEQEAEARLMEFVEGIKAERFRPSPSADCRWCAFKTLCPVWPEGDEVPL